MWAWVGRENLTTLEKTLSPKVYKLFISSSLRHFLNLVFFSIRESACFRLSHLVPRRFSFSLSSFILHCIFWWHNTTFKCLALGASDSGPKQQENENEWARRVTRTKQFAPRSGQRKIGEKIEIQGEEKHRAPARPAMTQSGGEKGLLKWSVDRLGFERNLQNYGPDKRHYGERDLMEWNVKNWTGGSCEEKNFSRLHQGENLEA